VTDEFEIDHLALPILIGVARACLSLAGGREQRLSQNFRIVLMNAMDANTLALCRPRA
jgi:hypothetical protein